MTIDKIFKNKKISVRSYNVCKSNKLNTIFELKDFYNKRGSFRYLRNCGSASNIELISICNNYDDINFEENYENEENSPKNIALILNRIQREVINSFILVNINNLSIRSQNAIKLFLDGNIKITNFSKKIFSKNTFEVKRIKNIGEKSISELEIFIQKIEDFLTEVSEMETEKHLISLKKYPPQQVHYFSTSGLIY